MSNTRFELVNPDTQSVVFGYQIIENADIFRNTNRLNSFVVMLVSEGAGSLNAELATYDFSAPSLMSFSLYQPFSITASGAFKAVMISFHPEFFCLHKHRHEVSCNGVLFNNAYESPAMGLLDTEASVLMNIFDGMRFEMQREGKPETDILVSFLKILLIDGVRMKLEKRGAVYQKEPGAQHELKALLEEHFKTKHSPGDYAELLNITPSALNRISKTHFRKTLSDLIAERLITEGKRELYLTGKPVKQIAYELGFKDEFYFSRYFKNHVGVSPQLFRDTVGFNKA
jgi:AraC family transcriptional regulator, transcriptional activator of pobA